MTLTITKFPCRIYILQFHILPEPFSWYTLDNDNCCETRPAATLRRGVHVQGSRTKAWKTVNFPVRFGAEPRSPKCFTLPSALITNNEIKFKFADITYLIVPAQDSQVCQDELDHVKCWARKNNLSLNCAKSKTIAFRGRGVRGTTTLLLSPVDGIERVHQITALSVIVDDPLTFIDHIISLLVSCFSLLYATRVLHSQGLPTSSLCDVSRVTLMAKILYCATACSGFVTSPHLCKLDLLLSCWKWTG